MLRLASSTGEHYLNVTFCDIRIIYCCILEHPGHFSLRLIKPEPDLQPSLVTPAPNGRVGSEASGTGRNSKWSPSGLHCLEPRCHCAAVLGLKLPPWCPFRTVRLCPYYPWGCSESRGWEGAVSHRDTVRHCRCHLQDLAPPSWPWEWLLTQERWCWILFYGPTLSCKS